MESDVMQLPAVETRDPLAQSLWMFVADLFVAAVPVMPLAFLPLSSARVASVVITGLLLVCLGAGRAKVVGTRLWSTICETAGLATAAAAAGLRIGTWVSH